MTNELQGHVLRRLFDILVLTVTGVVTYYIVALGDPFNFLGTFRRWWIALVGSTVILIVGLGLFHFKKHYQRVYGVAEIGFALAVGWASIERAQVVGDSTSWLAVLAAAYLVVRGITNYEEGRKQNPATI